MSKKLVKNSATLEERLDARTIKGEGQDACWTWSGVHNQAGYARVWFQGTMRYVHRLRLEQKLGRPLRPGEFACHENSCPTGPGCSRPEHLYAGSQPENQRDAREAGAMPSSSTGFLGVKHNHGGFGANLRVAGAFVHVCHAKSAKLAARLASMVRREVYGTHAVTAETLGQFDGSTAVPEALALWPDVWPKVKVRIARAKKREK